ncbi:IclR family transcriptional regulator [Paraburkholderia gardini]|uniref:IclR family transcriptional regulator n=1 Tax=Paraburkholderia gardini TaxID=2823469 RepID=UPI001DB8B607|nr:IclR family transcriptional regulator [Paraburkholderia gardini]CAG4914029.1 Glycerol operon regulatory protein [Paraburkholderia gardini]
MTVLDQPDVKEKKAGHRVRPVPAVTRSIAILRLLGTSAAPLGVKAIADELGLVPSTCLHILRVLVEEELVKIDPSTKRYSVGPGMLSLARSALKSGGFSDLVQPLLDDLASRYGVTTLGVEPSGLKHMVVKAMSTLELTVSLRVELGSRFPALISATGRCVAAYGDYTPADLQSGFEALRWQNPPDFDAWLKEVDLTRKRGYAVDRGNYIAGVTVVAVPVLDSRQRMAFGLVAVGLANQLNATQVSAIAADLVKAASELASTVVAVR